MAFGRIPKINSALQNTPVIDMNTGLMTQPWVKWFGQIGTGANFAFGFADGETPTGALGQPNFTLAQIPSPPESLRLFRNGQLLKLNVGYTLSGNLITFLGFQIPQVGDIIEADYRF